ncbi:thioredoxin fold domain-containing protein [Vibrio sp. SCSIO 43137]|uniref:thioredoxin fold domain-containing protein n=1 Tax=Vibrio sp. SCSIO 43137 TaxID=3021011 RepID=UPI00230810D1|nr:thioredoxin fold domain-containing protein [Vibrio sp. SCSIO 43137]WCE30219.1 thioredoxin fold domain-containing protein [Vibrio sp. SCSIO 43137]
MSILRRLTLLALPALVTACNAEEVKTETTESAAPQAATQNLEVAYDEARLKARFEKMGVVVNSIAPATFSGLVEVDTDSGLFFSNYAGDHFIAGALYSLDDEGKYVNLIEERKAPLNAKKIAAFEQDMIVYPADNEKYAITIFTDITCGYCVKLHNQMSGYNALGITVRYLAYPRQGPVGQVAGEMARIWCAKEPAKAMDKAKIERDFSEQVENVEQCQEKVKDQYLLGRDLGISGTPAIFLPNGKLIAGYMPPAALFARISAELGE